ncbi:MAG: transporter substrate-binding domain-containing protein [Desulfobacula sp.]|uniref:substrate-binding periplasmic protein n=1 Tax=Desulfobacula sp. TaxID=2593537 RepID=UPI0025C2660C|nr:transporter substrate-binding domain-containing protein [Desulfobacula sp.]MCD4720459.1 transporter substrate-binding domain-containing protein [Desulfobacula sp.]
MSKIFFQLFFMFISIVVAVPATAGTITIVADAWPPYNGLPNTSEPGYGIEIAHQVFKAAGYTVDYKIVPWNRAIIDTREGKYNAIIGANIEDAPDFIFSEEEFGVSKRDFWARKGSSWRFTGIESLLKVRIGAIKDYSYGKELDKFFKKNKELVQYVYGQDPLVQNIKKLLSGRIDITVENKNVFLQKAKKMGVSSQIISVGGSGSIDNLYIAFSPKIAKSREYAEIFTKGIRKLKDSGKLEKILAKYGLEYWK